MSENVVSKSSSAVADLAEPAAEPAAERFHESTEEDRQKLIDDALPKKTAQANAFWKRVLDEYCEKNSITMDFKTVSAEDLASVMERFLVDVRRKDGQRYKKNSLKAVRGAVQRLLVAENRTINVFTDVQFTRGRKILDGVLKERKRSGQEDQVLHAQALSESDWNKLGVYFKDMESTTDHILLAR